MRKYTPEHVTHLEPNEIFVFGSNAGGFHGAGSAGMAMRGEAKNNWRDDDDFLEAINKPSGAPERIGNWAIYGVARGFQEGRNGKSYAIETIKRPGLRRSTSLEEILSQLKELSKFAEAHPEYTFLVTKIGCALAGYTVEEIASVFFQAAHFPDNIILPIEFEFRS